MNRPSDQQGLTTRIGIISPDDAVNDDEYNWYLPKCVTLLWTRYYTAMRDEPISVEMVGSYGDLEVVRHAAKTLRITRPHVAAFLCNSCSFVHGPAGDERIREVIAETAGSLAVSISNAEVEALHALGVRRISVGAPYPEEVTVRLLDYLQASGFEVVASRSLGMTTEWQIGNTPPQHWLDVAREIDLIGGGVHGLWVMGSGSAMPCLTQSQRTQAITAISNANGKRLPILAGVSDTSLDHPIANAHQVESLGADAVFASAPYYCAFDDQDIETFFPQLASASPLPLVVYHNPFNSKIPLDLDLVDALSSHENIVGIKDSSCSLGYHLDLFRPVRAYTDPELEKVKSILSRNGIRPEKRCI